MASPKQEIEVIDQKTVLSSPVNMTSLKQNLYSNYGVLEVRGGFGQLSEFNSSVQAYPQYGNPAPYDTTEETGLQECLGNHYLKTDFGHEQIISIFLTRGYTSNIVKGPFDAWDTSFDDQPNLQDYISFYTIIIHDITNNTKYEEILYTHTSEGEAGSGQDDAASWLHGYYEKRDNTYGEWQELIGADDTRWWFTDYTHPTFGDQVYFGSKAAGTFIYNPTIFPDFTRPKWTNVINSNDEVNDWETGRYVESATIIPLALKDGIHTAGFSYVQKDDMPNFIDATVLNGHLFYAAGKTLYFSDLGDPNAIVGDNIVNIVADTDIVAIEGFNNFVIIWTEAEMFVYQPSWSASLLSGGSTTEIAQNIGCMHTQTVTKTDSGVFWADKNSFYRTGNGYNIENMGMPIKQFFQDEFPSPIINYFQATGFSDPAAETKPRFNYGLKGNEKGVHSYYNEKYQAIFFVVPELNIAWVYSGNDWIIWNWDSIWYQDPTTEVEQVGRTSHLKKQHLVGSFDTIYGMGGKTNFHDDRFQGVEVSQREWDDPLWRSRVRYYPSTFVLTQWKRGGAVDKSSHGRVDYDGLNVNYGINLEDNITSGEGYLRFAQNSPDEHSPILYFDRYFPKRVYLNVDKTNTIEPDEPVYLLPIRLTLQEDGASTSAFATLKALTLNFNFDSDNWIPVMNSGTDIDFMLDTERQGVFSGWTATYNSAADVNLIQLGFANGGLAEADVAWQGMQVNFLNKTNLILLPFKRRGSDPTAPTEYVQSAKDTWNIVDNLTTWSMSYATDAGDITTTKATYYIYTRGAHHPRISNYGKSLSVSPYNSVYPVDYFFKTGQIGMDGPDQLKTRGLYLKTVSHGVGSKTIFNKSIQGNWSYGLLNTHAGSDYKDYVTQIVDVDGISGVIQPNIQNLVEKSTLRSRIWDSTNGVRDRLFGTNLRYGDTTNAATGNYLIDVEECDTLAVSDSVKGGQVNYTIFGFMFDTAQRLLVQSVKVVIQAVSGRRRKGR